MPEILVLVLTPKNSDSKSFLVTGDHRCLLINFESSDSPKVVQKRPARVTINIQCLLSC